MERRCRLFLVALSTCQIVALTAAIVGVARGAADDPRLSFVGKRRNLALGTSYQYSRVPGYRLTTNEGDLTELTDGRLSEHKGERIWFDRHAVAWSGVSDINIVVDLERTQAVGEVAVRFLGGGEQKSLLFPRRVVVAVSEDGEHYSLEAAFQKGSDDKAFGLPAEQGTAWVYPLRFQNTNSPCRFVAISIRVDGSMCAMDELLILEGPSRSGRGRRGTAVPKPTVFPFGPNRYTAYPHKADWYAAETTTWTAISGYNTLPDKTLPVELLIDLPPEVELVQTMINERYGGKPVDAPQPIRIKEDEVDYDRYAVQVRALQERHAFYLFWRTNQSAGWSAPARIAAKWEGGEQPPAHLAIHAVDIPQAPRLKHVHLSLDWMNHTFWVPAEDHVLPIFERCGFTAVPYFGRYTNPNDTQLRDHLLKAKARGFNLVYNWSPMHELEGASQEHPEVLCQLPNGKQGGLCPSYRGPLFDTELERVAASYALAPTSWVFLDCEVHWSTPEQSEQCSRCRAARKQGESTADFLARMGIEIFGGLRRRLEAKAKAAGLSGLRMGSYAIHPSHTRYPVLPFDRLYPDVLDFAMPSIYVHQPKSVGEAVAADRARMQHNHIIPWLQPGNLGEKSSSDIFEELVSALLAGGEGATYYTFHGFDAADFAAVSRAVRTIAPYEQVIANGEPITQWGRTTDYVAYGKRLDQQAVWMVACDEVRSANVNLKLPFSSQQSVFELTDGRKERVELKSGRLSAQLDPGQVRIFASDLNSDANTTATEDSTKKRVFNDSTGKFSVKAEYLGLRDGNVSLKKEDGTEISIPLAKFSEADRDWVRRQSQAQRNEKKTHPDGM